MWTLRQNQKREITKYMYMRVERYEILSMPLYSFQDDANCLIDNNHIENLTTWLKV